MNITDLAAEPKLVEITLKDEDIVAKYGDSISFWVWDRQPIEYYLQLSKRAEGADQIDAITNIAKTMILDNEGNPVMRENKILPSDVSLKAFTAVMEQLGK